ncbi:cold-responsive protein kinase 1-like isoform X1 [Daucus carota subsp. sativus]|nr:PREDICTED: probable LRR receptor-like serine/threonine-protein kinase At1g53430 isoform X2 [Daucus carota subsp. sativus]
MRGVDIAIIQLSKNYKLRSLECSNISQKLEKSYSGSLTHQPGVVCAKYQLINLESTSGVMACFTTCFNRKTPPPTKHGITLEEEVSNIQNIILYSYKELRRACDNFRAVNKIGMGGFGSVYKGKLKNGTMVAVKVLSEGSTQGIQEFLTEITMISSMQHDNLVKLYGCCAEGVHRILVYGYLENNSLAQTLLGPNHRNIQFSWNVRKEICIGVARGLAYLHEEIQPHIVHRDIKASNILLDENLNAKISDFGLAKLFPPNMTHISTHVAGTLGYLAPEYALRRQLTRKADIYSFGVLLLEIVCGRCNKNERSPTEDETLLGKAWELYNKGELLELIDASLARDTNMDEAVKYVKICFVCTQEMPKLRPLMSTVVKMLTGEIEVQGKLIAKPGILPEAFLRRNIITGDASSPGYSSIEASPMRESTFISHGTMTFSSIYNRNS